MADELEEFLRQAAARRQQRQKGAGNKPASGGPAARPTAAGSSPDRFAGSSKEGVGNTGAGVVRGPTAAAFKVAATSQCESSRVDWSLRWRIGM
jgi:hypothetical protein